MLFLLSPQTYASAAILIFLVYYAVWIIYSRCFHPYHDIPGPFLASITSWHRWYSIRYGIRDNLQRALHDKYGPFVRIAPDEVQISDPSAIDTIYKPGFRKTEFYDSFNPGIGGRPEPFAERNEQIHARLRKTLNPLFRPEAIAEYEGYIDNVIEIFCNKVDGLDELDLAQYVAKYSWDTVGDMVYSREGGFGNLRDDTDYMGWMSMVKVMQRSVSCMGYVPYGLGKLYLLSQLIFSSQTRKGLLSAMTVVKQVKALILDRKVQEAAGEDFRPHDMLSRMMEMTRDEKLDFNEDDIAIVLNAFVWAGSDTTGSTLAMIMYFIFRDARVYTKLQAEIDSASNGKTLSYSDASKLPYLSACIAEGMRCHLIFGAGLPRYIPRGGAQVCGRYLAGGYKVQANPNVTNLDKSIFGDDADQFKPERWIDNDDATIARMTRYHHPFGYGTRVCLGRYVALTEMYKFIPLVLSRYHFELLCEPTVTRGWFQQPEGMIAKVSKRNGKK